MKKAIVLILALVGGIVSESAAQTDYWVGKWEFFVKETPQGDVKMTGNLLRKDGKLTGDLTPITSQATEKIAISSIEESTDKIVLFFSAAGYDLNLALNKVDGDNLKGLLADSFEATGKRLKSNDFFAGKWDIVVVGTPNGDAKFTTELIRKDGKLTGDLKMMAGDAKETIPAKVEEAEGKITLYFSAQGYDVNVELNKVDDDNLKGTLMNMFEAKAKRVK